MDFHSVLLRLSWKNRSKQASTELAQQIEASNHKTFFQCGQIHSFRRTGFQKQFFPQKHFHIKWIKWHKNSKIFLEIPNWVWVGLVMRCPFQYLLGLSNYRASPLSKCKQFMGGCWGSHLLFSFWYSFKATSIWWMMWMRLWRVLSMMLGWLMLCPWRYLRPERCRTWQVARPTPRLVLLSTREFSVAACFCLFLHGFLCWVSSPFQVGQPHLATSERLSHGSWILQSPIAMGQEIQPEGPQLFFIFHFCQTNVF